MNKAWWLKYWYVVFIIAVVAAGIITYGNWPRAMRQSGMADNTTSTVMGGVEPPSASDTWGMLLGYGMDTNEFFVDTKAIYTQGSSTYVWLKNVKTSSLTERYYEINCDAGKVNEQYLLTYGSDGQLLSSTSTNQEWQDPKGGEQAFLYNAICSPLGMGNFIENSVIIPTSTSGYRASNGEMATSCQEIADQWLREDLFVTEHGGRQPPDRQPPIGSDKAYYNSTKSICYFTDDITYYPQIGSGTPVSVDQLNLRAAAMWPDGIGQEVLHGDITGVAILAASCGVSSYSTGSQKIYCTTQDLTQTGAGTSNYTANANAGIGSPISETKYQSLVSQYMSGN